MHEAPIRLNPEMDLAHGFQTVFADVGVLCDHVDVPEMTLKYLFVSDPRPSLQVSESGRRLQRPRLAMSRCELQARFAGQVEGLAVQRILPSAVECIMKKGPRGFDFCNGLGKP